MKFDVKVVENGKGGTTFKSELVMRDETGDILLAPLAESIR